MTNLPKEKRLENHFLWTNNSNTPGLKKPYPDPKFYLTTSLNKDEEHVSDIYFVNNTNETLLSVEASTGGFQTLDDDIISYSGNPILYSDVKPKEAVRIDLYHEILDSDYVIQFDIIVALQQSGKMHFRITEKGGIKELVILKQDGTSKYLIGD